MRLFVSVVVAGTTAIVLSSCGEYADTRVAYYPDYQAAKDSGKMELGWIPDFLPGSARSVYLTYNLDSNEVWMRFSFPTGATDELLRVCEEDSLAVADYPRLPLRGHEWWPHELTKNAASDTTQHRFSELLWCKRYRIGGEGQRVKRFGFMVIEGAENTAYYWERSSRR